MANLAVGLLCSLVAGAFGLMVVVGGKQIQMTGASPRWHIRRPRTFVAIRTAVARALRRWWANVKKREEARW